MNLLILGGTNDALRLAASLNEHLCRKGIIVIYSLAGLVRTPEIDCKVITGGFTQHGGLSNYINSNSITGIVDATHPYASKISDEAYAAALDNHIPYWQFERLTWKKQSGDNWFEYSNWDELLPMLKDKRSVFITTGQLDSITLDTLSKKLLATSSVKVILRTAIKPKNLEQFKQLSEEKIQWVQAIGPFTLEDEIALMQKHAIDALISKNSGGDATIAKLHAAKKLQVPVYLLKRPQRRFQITEVNVKGVFCDVSDCKENVLQYFNETVV